MIFLKFTICTIIINHLWKTHEALKVHHINIYIYIYIYIIAYGEMLDLLTWKRLTSLIKFLRMEFMDFMVYWKI